MARAKRTDRAEARRRYRATLTEELEPDELDDGAGAEDEPVADRQAAGRSRAKVTAAAAPPARPARPSIVNALRSAFRPTDLRGDLAALPGLLRHRSFFVPLALILGAAGLLVATAGTDPISRMLSPYFLAPPPVAPVFLAGFLAPRASYLLGALLGAVASVALVAILSSPVLQQAATGSATATGVPADVIGQYFIVGIIGGGFYAAAAAWYKRFLALANPNRAARAAAKPGDRPRRRNSNDRPLVARRR